MTVILLSIYGALGVLFWRWLHQNHHGASTKGLVFWTWSCIIEFSIYSSQIYTCAWAFTLKTPAHKHVYALGGSRARAHAHTPKRLDGVLIFVQESQFGRIVIRSLIIVSNWWWHAKFNSAFILIKVIFVKFKQKENVGAFEKIVMML